MEYSREQAQLVSLDDIKPFMWNNCRGKDYFDESYEVLETSPADHRNNSSFRGSFGVVRKVRCKKSGNNFALKQTKLEVNILNTFHFPFSEYRKCHKLGMQYY